MSLQPLLAGLPAEDREVLAGLGIFTTCPAGAFLTEEDIAVSSLWILAERRLNVEVGHGASRTSLTVLEAGSLVGEASYLTGRPATASVTALSDCRLIEVAHARLRVACEERPSFGLRFERLLVDIFTQRLSRSLGTGSRVELPAVDAAFLKSLRELQF